MRRALWCFLAALLVVANARSGSASVIDVGPTQRLKLPSQAAAIVKPGDTVRIAPGDYADCAAWEVNNLTIEGIGSGATIADKSCAGKGIFIIGGSDVTVRNLTFARAAVPDHNGAGIRAEGHNLVVIHCRFLDNENGILGALIASGTIRVFDSDFRGNGKCDPQCAHGIYAGRIDLLDIERSRFIDQHVGHHIKSRALRTVLIANDIADGPAGNSSYLIDISNGGDLLMKNNVLEKGPHTENNDTAVAIGFEGARNPTDEIIIQGNRFTNDMAQPTIFVHNRTTTPARLSGNHLQGSVTPLVGPGTVSP